MRKIEIIAVVIIALLVAVFLLLHRPAQNNPAPIPNNQNQNTSNNNQPQPSVPNNNNPQNQSPAVSPNSSAFQPPLDRAGERVTKKTFGLYVTPQNSPVQPERFTGFHTGADFETFPEELNSVVTVHAVCTGKLLVKEYATGYGGVAVQACNLNGSPITVIYGHLKLASIAPTVGTNLNVGDTLGILGAAYSSETNGERKHLHLGFHKGTAVSILGYVQNKADLSGWIDPCLYVCHD